MGEVAAVRGAGGEARGGETLTPQALGEGLRAWHRQHRVARLVGVHRGLAGGGVHQQHLGLIVPPDGSAPAHEGIDQVHGEPPPPCRPVDSATRRSTIAVPRGPAPTTATVRAGSAAAVIVPVWRGAGPAPHTTVPPGSAPAAAIWDDDAMTTPEPSPRHLPPSGPAPPPGLFG